MPKYLSQKDFDSFCQEAMDEGQSLEEAAADTREMFLDSGYDLSRVWVCTVEGGGQGKEEKTIVQRNVEQIKKTLRGEDSYLNASFSLAKLRQVCKRQSGDEDTGTRVFD